MPGGLEPILPRHDVRDKGFSSLLGPGAGTSHKGLEKTVFPRERNSKNLDTAWTRLATEGLASPQADPPQRYLGADKCRIGRAGDAERTLPAQPTDHPRLVGAPSSARNWADRGPQGARLPEGRPRRRRAGGRVMQPRGGGHRCGPPPPRESPAVPRSLPPTMCPPPPRKPPEWTRVRGAALGLRRA